VASQIVKQLEDRGWVESIGFREAPGRPALLATTKQFLDDLGLAGLRDLPGLQGSGEPLSGLGKELADRLPLQASLLDPQASLVLEEVAAPSADAASRPTPSDESFKPVELKSS
jgi:segregation and condensation protein B